MRKRLARLALTAALAMVSAAPALAPALAQDQQAAGAVERGRYLAILGDCAACHTKPGGKPFAGGLVIETPFGNLAAANITPDRTAGIGAWSDDDFVRAMQTGVAPDGTHLYPAMPYPAFTHVTRDDLLALRAYLATVDPVSDAVETNRLPFPFNIRALMIGWNLLNFTAGEYQPDPAKPDLWNRGAYLVDGLGHCGTCHTPKNRLGGDKSDQPLAGAALQGWYAPSLNGDTRTGLGAWSADDIAAYLKTGWGGGQAASGPMGLVVADSTSQLTDADLQAIAVYLKDLAAPAGNAPAPLAGTDPGMQRGRDLYVTNCAACHTETGGGQAGIFPALAKSPVVQADNAATLIDVVLNGGHAVATDAAPTAPGMPAFGWKLSDDQIAAILTYIRNDWGNAASPVASGDVSAARARPAAAN
jgi:mono/diheme cytochrome c family protein